MTQGVALTVSFAKPGFFLNDPRLTVWFNGHVIYDGGFLSGFETSFPVLPGTHSLAVKLTTPLFDRSKQYAVVVRPAHACRVVLEYSRFWGNFGSTPLVQHI